MRRRTTPCLAFTVLITTLFFSLKGVAVQPEEKAFPKNDQSYPVGLKSSRGLTASEFLEAINNFKEIWGPEIESKYGKELEIEEKWYSDKVNAHATRDWFNNAVLVIHGGMARHPEMTLDGFYLILCHELGHQFGGAPKKFRGNSKKRSWSSAEGQADYFATSKCLPRIFDQVGNHSYEKRDQRLKAIIRKKEGRAIKKLCRSNMCERVALASLSVARMFQSIQNITRDPELLKRAGNEVYKTHYDHPRPQCRLDTYLAGYFCKAHRELNVDDENATIGFCAGKSAQSVRPRCWFHPEKY